MFLSTNDKLDAILQYLALRFEEVSTHVVAHIKLGGSSKFEDGSTEKIIPTVSGRVNELYSFLLMIYQGTCYNEISDRDDLEMLLEFLIKEEYVISKMIDNEIHYKITFEGRHFIENGGYVGKFNRENEEATKVDKLQKATLILTIVLAIPAFPTAVYYSSELMKEHSIHVMAGLLFFLFGTIAGLLIALLVLELRSKRKSN